MSQRSFLLLGAALLGLRFVTLPVLPMLDPSEARYALVARDMLESGDFVTPMIWANGEHIPFFSKPPLLFWMQAASLNVLGNDELAVRLPPFLCALAALGLTWVQLRRYFSPDVLRGALLILFSFPLFYLCAGIGLTDMVLCVAVTGALFSHYGFTRESDPAVRKRLSRLTFLFLGMGMVTKGPIAIVQFGLPVFLWTLRRRRWTDLTGQAWAPGLVLFVVLWAPWFALTERANPGFLEYFFVNENLLRFVASEYGDRYGGGHKFPPGAAIVFFLLACFPWVILVARRMRDAASRREAWIRLREPDVELLAFAVLVNIGFLSFSRHILGTYVLPVLPAAAVLFSCVFGALGIDLTRQAKVATGLVAAYSLAVVAALPLVQGRWSSQSVIAEAVAFQQSRGADGRLVFIDKRPFSARYYGSEFVLDQIPWDAGNEHFWWYLDPPNGHLIVLRDKHVPVLDPYVTDRIRKVSDAGSYGIWEPVLPDPEAATASVGKPKPGGSTR